MGDGAPIATPSMGPATNGLSGLRLFSEQAASPTEMMVASTILSATLRF